MSCHATHSTPHVITLTGIGADSVRHRGVQTAYACARALHRLVSYRARSALGRLVSSVRTCVRSDQQCIRNNAQMPRFDSCAGPAHPTGQAKHFNPPPRVQETEVDLMSPTFGSVAAAVTNLRILRADRQIEWLSIMRDMHGPRAARQSMPTVRVRLPLANVGAAALACASRQAQAAIITTCARPRVDHRRQRLPRTRSWLE